MAKGLAEQSKRITDMLDRFDQHLERSGSLNVSIPTTANETTNKIESINSVLSSQLEDPESIPSHNRLCSKCNSPMNIRTATKGEHLGEQFYVCSNYPTCREVLPA
jgi:ferritin-like metal-binding protein YciE